MGRTRRIVGVVVLGVVLVVGGGVALGLLGTPSLSGVDNQFGSVNETNTIVYTDLHVSNPNPVGVQLGDVSVNYTVSMNDVALAGGQREGIGIATGNSTLNLTTAMDNRQIPAWWYTHVDNRESTVVDIEARIETPLGQASFGQSRGIETDVAGQFDSNETRPVEADRPFVEDPVLYVNRTRGSWDQPNVTRERTPLDLDFTVYNPKSVPYTVSTIGYNVTMNGIPVGEGATDRGYVIEPETTETIGADAAIRNERLDEWWVSHLQRNQVTDVRIDFYLLVEFADEQFRIDLDAIDYETTIETDIFGNKAETADEENETSDSGDSTTTTEVGDTATPTDDGGLLGDEEGTETPTDDGGLLDETTATDTETATDDGTADTSTDDGTTDTPTATDNGTTDTPTATDDGILGDDTETTEGVL